MRMPVNTGFFANLDLFAICSSKVRRYYSLTMDSEDMGQDEAGAATGEDGWRQMLQEFLTLPPIQNLLIVLESKSGEYLSKISEELSKETWRFSKEEKQVKAAFEKIINDNRSLLIQNINSFRSFILTLVGFSLTIIGFVASGLGKEGSTRHAALTKVGLLMLAGTVVLGVLHVLVIHIVENSRMDRLVRDQRKALKDILLAIKASHDSGRPFDRYLAQKIDIINATEESHKKLMGVRDDEFKTWPRYVLPVTASILFSAGAILVAISYLK